MATWDISIPIAADMPAFPGDPPVRMEGVRRISAGDAYDLTALFLSSHTGTHVDAPSHFIPCGATIDKLPLELFDGPAWVCNLERLGRITVTELDRARIPPGTRRLLCKTDNSRLWQLGAAQPRYTHLTEDAAEWLVATGIQLVGIDYLSIDAPDVADFPVHRTLLGSGVIILEGLDMSIVESGAYRLACYPLRLQSCDGSPTRAVLHRG